MSDEQRKQLVFEYLKRLDHGEEILDLFDEKAEAYFPKWGVARGKSEIKRLFSDLYELFQEIFHPLAYANVIQQGDVIVVEGTTYGRLKDGTAWNGGAGGPAGRYVDVIEVRDFKIQRIYIYTDPDYAGADRARFPWLNR